MIYGVAPFLSWSKSICDPDMGIMRIGGLRRLLPSFEGEHMNTTDKAGQHLSLQGQAPRFPHGWLKISGSPRYLHYDCVHQKQVLGRSPNPSTLQTLSSLTWSFHGIWVKALGLEPPSYRVS